MLPGPFPDSALVVAAAVPAVLATAELATIGLVHHHRGGFQREFHLMGLLLAVDMALISFWLFEGNRILLVTVYLVPASYLVFALAGWVWEAVIEQGIGPHREPAPRWLAAVAVAGGLGVWAAHAWVLATGSELAPAGTSWPFADGFALAAVALGAYVLADRKGPGEEGPAADPAARSRHP